MTYSAERQAILDQIQELGGYRDTEELDDWYDGPLTRWELFKAFWRDQWDRTKKPSNPHPFTWHWQNFIFWGLVWAPILFVILSHYSNKAIADTPKPDAHCMRSCKSLDGLMVERTRYGCTCHLHEGGKKVLR